MMPSQSAASSSSSIAQGPLSLEDVLAHAQQLPSLPDVILKLSRMLEEPDVTAEELGRLIQLDPQLTAQMLRTCNSAYFGLNRKVTHMKEAVALMGQKALKSMVYAILSKKMLGQEVQGYGLGKGELWVNALTGGIYAKKIAELYHYKDPETAFTAAILRDLGKIVLHQFVGQRYEALEAQAQKNRQGFEAAEHELLGFSHTEVGELLAQQWNFPPSLSLSIRYHHQPQQAPAAALKEGQQGLLLAVVHLADTFSTMLGAGVGNDGLMYPVNLEFVASQGLDVSPEAMETLTLHLLSCKERIQQLAEQLT